MGSDPARSPTGPDADADGDVSGRRTARAAPSDEARARPLRSAVDLRPLRPERPSEELSAPPRVRPEGPRAGGNALGADEPEFNFACDPEAAALVVATAPGLRVCGLDACAPGVEAAAAALRHETSVFASLYTTDAYAARCDPVAAFLASSTGAAAFDVVSAAASVDEATGVLTADGGARSVAVATRLADREAYAAWLLGASRGAAWRDAAPMPWPERPGTGGA